MAYRKLPKKIQAGRNIMAEKGFVSLLIASLEKIQKKQSKIASDKGPIYTKARYSDILKADINQPPAKWVGSNKQKLRFNWIMPPPGKGSGGHLNIFRFIAHLEKAGHICQIYMYVPGNHGSVSGVKAVMGNSYPPIKALNRMKWLNPGEEMAPAEAIFATSWETAYPAFNSRLLAKRFYFVQDFEPYFYAPGSMYSLAENTYRFGFYGVTAGGWLAIKLRRDYGMATDHYNFGSDSNIYSCVNGSPRKEIFFYARPFTERRGFELGIMALDLFHKRHPQYIINLAGWDVSEYEIPFPYKNLMTLELSQLNELYNRCATALVLSFTNMSLLPLELLASGCIPVVNAGENNSLVSDNGFIAYSQNDVHSLAGKLSDIVTKSDLPDYAARASASVKRDTWQDAGRKFVEIVERETRRHE